MEISQEFDLICAICGGTLNAVQESNGDIRVEPCQECLDRAYESGKAEGGSNND